MRSVPFEALICNNTGSVVGLRACASTEEGLEKRRQVERAFREACGAESGCSPPRERGAKGKGRAYRPPQKHPPPAPGSSDEEEAPPWAAILARLEALEQRGRVIPTPAPSSPLTASREAAIPGTSTGGVTRPKRAKAKAQGGTNTGQQQGSNHYVLALVLVRLEALETPPDSTQIVSDGPVGPPAPTAAAGAGSEVATPQAGVISSVTGPLVGAAVLEVHSKDINRRGISIPRNVILSGTILFLVYFISTNLLLHDATNCFDAGNQICFVFLNIER
ncbi:uncharacterized protein LOC133363657 [Rhineura floridana]|uniref:uncharacterized protein LOC133363657 n=1 Tax=Rhineura floridana TaxID=261503 RepID=UPI002AC8797E|nr:uncharacterized protein LOC133363657 [Rhineura floridana]